MRNPTAISQSCTVQRANGSFCDAKAGEDYPFPICNRHAIRLFRHMAAVVNERGGDSTLRSQAIMEGLTELPRQLESLRPEDRDPVVYYVRIGPHIKVGTSIDLANRMRQYPPYAELLATEPGGFDVEARRIKAFSASVAHGREWLNPTRDVMHHVQRLQARAAESA